MIRRCVSRHGPVGRFPDISTAVGIARTVGVKKVSVVNMSVRAFRRRMVRGSIGTLLVVEQSSLEKRPQRGVIHTHHMIQRTAIPPP